MITDTAARKQLETLHQEGMALAEEFDAEQRERQELYGTPEQEDDPRPLVVIQDFRQKRCKPKPEAQLPEPPPEKTRFAERYQSWYSRALPLMKQLAPDRYAEF